MTLVIPVKRRDATSLGELTSSDQIAPTYVAGLLGRNMLINCDMQINQRGFGGGALGAGVYGYDRWKAGTGGCNVSVNSAGVVTHTSGPLVQIVESPSGVYGANVTFSVQDPSGAVNVSVGGVSGSITAGSGRRSVTLAIPSGSGNLTVQITATGVTYSRPQLERGDAAAGSDFRPQALELMLCQRYYEKSFAINVAPGGSAGRQGAFTISQILGNDLFQFGNNIRYLVQKRSVPAITFYSPVNGSGQPRNVNRGSDAASISVDAESGTVGLSFYFRTSNPSQAGDSNVVHWTADAEL